MRHFAYILVLVGLLTACTQQQPNADFAFQDEARLPMTPVKDQLGSDLCWAYAMLATIETEHIVQGDSVNLSVDFVARHLLGEQTVDYFKTLRHRPITMRGMATRLIKRIMKDGLLSYDSYHSTTCNYRILQRKLRSMADVAISRHQTLAEVVKKTEQLLDTEIRPVPRYQFLYGAEYTTREFAHSVCLPDEYIALTSFSHKPYFEPFVLDLPDNYDRDSFMNLPIDSLLSLTEQSLRRGHPVCWEGDNSDSGFDFQQGIAVTKEKPSQELRQKLFEQRNTTDDHCMCIIGLARDKEEKPYFICKNSWGADNPYGGLVYMSFDYFYLKTIAVVLSKNELYGESL